MSSRRLSALRPPTRPSANRPGGLAAIAPLALLALLCLSATASAQSCDQATREFKLSDGAAVRDQDKVDEAYRQAVQACGGLTPELQRAVRPKELDAPQLSRPPRTPPGELVNCDAAGCWGSANNVRYSFVTGGNLAGADGSFCTRSAGGTFTCR